MIEAPHGIQFVNPRPLKVPLAIRLKAKIARHRIAGLDLPPGMCLTWTVPEVAAVLGIAEHTAYAAIRKGQIPSITFKAKIVVPKLAVLNLIEAASVVTTQQGVETSCPPSSRKSTPPKTGP